MKFTPTKYERNTCTRTYTPFVEANASLLTMLALASGIDFLVHHGDLSYLAARFLFSRNLSLKRSSP